MYKYRRATQQCNTVTDIMLDALSTSLRFIGTHAASNESVTEEKIFPNAHEFSSCDRLRSTSALPRAPPTRRMEKTFPFEMKQKKKSRFVCGLISGIIVYFDLRWIVKISARMIHASIMCKRQVYL
jgi:hypothetical protein